MLLYMYWFCLAVWFTGTAETQTLYNEWYYWNYKAILLQIYYCKLTFRGVCTSACFYMRASHPAAMLAADRVVLHMQCTVGLIQGD